MRSIHVNSYQYLYHLYHLYYQDPTGLFGNGNIFALSIVKAFGYERRELTQPFVTFRQSINIDFLTEFVQLVSISLQIRHCTLSLLNAMQPNKAETYWFSVLLFCFACHKCPTFYLHIVTRAWSSFAFHMDKYQLSMCESLLCSVYQSLQHIHRFIDRVRAKRREQLGLRPIETDGSLGSGLGVEFQFISHTRHHWYAPQVSSLYGCEEPFSY